MSIYEDYDDFQEAVFDHLDRYPSNRDAAAHLDMYYGNYKEMSEDLMGLVRTIRIRRVPRELTPLKRAIRDVTGLHVQLYRPDENESLPSP